MSTILTSAIVENAKSSVDTYVSTIDGLNNELEGVINTLTGTNFIGDASNGYKAFYTSKVLPALTDNLISQGNSLSASIKAILDNIQQQLLNTVDPQLGTNNANPGVSVAGGAAAAVTSGAAAAAQAVTGGAAATAVTSGAVAAAQAAMGAIN
ncbi:MAG: hypothetical protein E7510_09750 [Ruminococcus sp.]|nr:hypothetical protein [Ruminococcus sp.]